MFFSYHWDLGLVFHKTAEAAKARAETDFDQDRQATGPNDDWPEGSDETCWGEVKQCVTKISEEPTDNGSLIEYELKDA